MKNQKKSLKAGRIIGNHIQTRAGALKVKTGVKAGGSTGEIRVGNCG